jgi:hypothetical protein
MEYKICGKRGNGNTSKDIRRLLESDLDTKPNPLLLLLLLMMMMMMMITIMIVLYNGNEYLHTI